MAHEEDGSKIGKKVALLVRCRDRGHIYTIDLKSPDKPKCKECGCAEYDIVDEIYKNEEQEDG